MNTQYIFFTQVRSTMQQNNIASFTCIYAYTYALTSVNDKLPEDKTENPC